MTTPTPSEALAEEIERTARQAIESGDSRLCLMMNHLQAKEIIDALRAGPPEGTVQVTALWLRASGRHAQMLFEHGGKWYLACEETMDGPFSHIVEDGGMKHFDPDPLAAASSGGKD